MSVRKTVTIRCDGASLELTVTKKTTRLVQCERFVQGNESEPADIVRYKAAGEGWKCERSSYDYCPVHAPAAAKS